MHIGPYRVLRVLARGGMGEVCLATLERAGGFRKQVALKRALPEFAADPDFVVMFQREARVAAALNHRNIVQVFDFDHHADQAWIAMEYVRGVDLKAVLDAERLPLGLAVDIGRACARGLDYVHRAADASGQPLNLVHQDVSPANVLLSYEGDVKLSDFGVAWQRDTARRGLQGKLGYMSPEAVRGARLDARSDQFALGAVLYEMFAGCRAFWADDGAEAILERIRHATPLAPLAEVAPAVPDAVRAVVARALAVDPADRFPDVAALSEALEAAAVEVDRSVALGSWLSARFPETDSVASEPPLEVTAAAVAPILVDGTAPPLAPIVPDGGTAPPAAPIVQQTAPPLAPIEGGTAPPIKPIVEPSGPAVAALDDALDEPGGRGGILLLLLLLVGGGAAAALLWPDDTAQPVADASRSGSVPRDARVDAAPPSDAGPPRDARVLDAAPRTDTIVADAAVPSDAAVVTAPPKAPRTRPRAPKTRAPRTRPPRAVPTAPPTRAPRTVASVAAAPPTAAPATRAAPPTVAAPPAGPRLRVLSRGAQLSGAPWAGGGWHRIEARGALIRVKGTPSITVRLKPQTGRFVATVSSKPFDTLTLDGRSLGSTPAASVPLSAGRHTISVGATRLVVEVGF